MSPVKVRAQKTLALHKLNLNHYQKSTADRERGGGGVLKQTCSPKKAGMNGSLTVMQQVMNVTQVSGASLK